MGILGSMLVVVVSTFGAVASVSAEDHGMDSAAGAATGVAEPSGILTLEDALRVALVRSPTLAVHAAQIHVEEARALQAGLPPNPEIVAEVEDVAGSGDYADWESGQTTLSVAQRLELAGKRAKRLRVAELDRDLAAWDYEERRLDVFAGVGDAFTATLAAQERLELAEELLTVAGSSVRSVSTSVKTGAVSVVEETRALAMLGQARAARAEAGRALAQARIELASTWGSAAPLFASAAGDLAVLAPPATLDSLLQSIVGNPGVGRWESEQARRRALLSLEQAQRIPDLTVSAGARHFADGDDAAMVFGLAVPLPLFDRNQGSILAAERALTQATSAERAASVAAEAALRRSHAALSAAFDEATELRDSAIPNASRTYEGARTAYSRGLFRYLEVLDAQRTLYELRGQYVDTLERYHLAAISIARVTGSLRAPTSAATDEVQLR